MKDDTFGTVLAYFFHQTMAQVNKFESFFQEWWDISVKSFDSEKSESIKNRLKR